MSEIQLPWNLDLLVIAQMNTKPVDFWCVGECHNLETAKEIAKEEKERLGDRVTDFFVAFKIKD